MGKANSKILFNAAWTSIDEEGPLWFGDNHYVDLFSLCKAQITLCSCIFTCKGSRGACHPGADRLPPLRARVYSWPSRREIQGVAPLCSVRASAFCHAPLSALSAPLSVLAHQRGSQALPKALEQVSLAQSLHRGSLTCLLGYSRDLLTIKGLEWNLWADNPCWVVVAIITVYYINIYYILPKYFQNIMAF